MCYDIGANKKMDSDIAQAKKKELHSNILEAKREIHSHLEIAMSDLRERKCSQTSSLSLFEEGRDGLQPIVLSPRGLGWTTPRNVRTRRSIEGYDPIALASGASPS